MAPILEEPTPAPLAAPETPEAKARRIIDGMQKKDPPKALREEFRELLDQKPSMAPWNGDWSHIARMTGLARFESQPIIEESIKARLTQLRNELAGSDPSPLEALLADAIVLAHQDHYS